VRTRYCTIIPGSFNRDRQVRFGLSPEEVGLLLDQLPQHEVEIVRRIYNSNISSTTTSAADNDGLMSSVDGGVGVGSGDNLEKVMRIVPGDGGVVSFKVDGAGTGDYDGNQLLEVDVQLGEFQVMREIMRSSLPALVGWSTQLDIAMRRSVDDVVQQQQQQGQYGGGGARRDNGRGASSDGRVPF